MSDKDKFLLVQDYLNKYRLILKRLNALSILFAEIAPYFFKVQYLKFIVNL